VAVLGGLSLGCGQLSFGRVDEVTDRMRGDADGHLRVGPRTVRPGSPRLKAACGAASRLGFAEALTRGPLPGLGREYGQGLRPRPG